MYTYEDTLRVYLRGHTTRALTVLPSPTIGAAIVAVVLCAVAHSRSQAVTASIPVLIHGHSANAVPAFKYSSGDRSGCLCRCIVLHTYEASEQGRKHIAVSSSSTEQKARRPQNIVLDSSRAITIYKWSSFRATSQML